MRPARFHPDRLPFLDGVRGFAALYVLVCHCCQWGGWNPGLPDANVAVDSFMVLSGFLMAWQWRLRNGDSVTQSSYRAFLIRRFFRIAPVYYLVLAIVFTGLPLFKSGLARWQQANLTFWASDSIDGLSAIHLSAWNLLLHVSFLFGLVPRFVFSNISLVPDWSIGLEMQFYAVFPLIVWCNREFGIARTTGAAAMVAFLSSHLAHLYPDPAFIGARLLLFLVGILTAEAALLFAANAARASYLLGIAVVLATRDKPRVIVSLALLLFVLAAFRSSDSNSRLIPMLRAALGNRFTAFLADCSYSVYLIHALVIALCAPVLAGRPVIQRTVALIAADITISYCVGYVLHISIESPVIRLGKSIEERFLTPLGARAATSGHA
jgi:peptidoglycan/LPS O-acetylase OafA/YrhL